MPCHEYYMPCHVRVFLENHFLKENSKNMPCLQLVGTWVKHNFKNLVSEFLTCPRLVGTWVKHIFRNLIPQLWRVMLFVACHVLNVACHGVSIPFVSQNSVSYRVINLRVGVSVPCRGHPAREMCILFAFFRPIDKFD